MSKVKSDPLNKFSGFNFLYKFPEYARRIEGCPSQVEFEHPINIERKKGHE